MKKETRGRKPTGRKRNKLFPGKFTQKELEEIKTKASDQKQTQSDVVLTGIRKLKKENK